MGKHVVCLPQCVHSTLVSNSHMACMCRAWVGCAMHGVGCMGVQIYGVFMELNVTTKCDRCYLSMQGGFTQEVCHASGCGGDGIEV